MINFLLQSFFHKRKSKFPNSHDKNANKKSRIKPSKEDLEAGNSDTSDKSFFITFFGASRYWGNNNHHLPKVLDKIYENMSDPRHCEILLAIDQEDNLGYYLRLKHSYKDKLRIKFFVFDKPYGYLGIHLYYKTLLEESSSKTRVYGVVSDDSIYNLENFDLKIKEVDESYSDNIYFIETNCLFSIPGVTESHKLKATRNELLPEINNDPFLSVLCSLRWEPSSLFPAFSRGVLLAAMEAQRNMPDQVSKDWAYISNGVYIDCYIDYIKSALFYRYNIKRTVNINICHILNLPSTKDAMYCLSTPKLKTNAYNIYEALGIKKTIANFNNNDFGLLQFCRTPVFEHLDSISKIIYERIGKNG